MVRSSRCENCGALAVPTALCRYCGAVARTEDLVAAGFGDGDDAFGVMRDAAGVRVSILGTRALRVEVPPQFGVGPAVIGCAWTRGVFVDLDVSAAVRFEQAPEGLTAGVWLRSSTANAVCVALSPSGKLSVTTRRDEGRILEPLGTVAASAAFPRGMPLVLRAKVAGAVLTVYRNGWAAMSVACPTDITGGADLVVDAPRSECGIVVFEDACARLP